MSVLIPSLRPAIAVPGWAKNELWRRAKAVPSLDLRFADNKSLVDATTGQNLITFTRSSIATYVDSQGVIRNATTNLLLRSEEFDSAAWTAVRATPDDNTVVAPNGELTASTFTTNDTDPYIFQAVSSPAGTYTFSVYIKAKPGNSTNNLKLRVVDATLGVLSSNTLTLTTEWQRFQYTVACPNGITQVRIDAPDQPGTAGDVVYLWGAQLEQSSTVGEYIPTTSTINSAPRFDHDPTTGESLGLLVEESRSNLLLNSGTLSTQNVTVTAVAHTLSFTGTGTITLSGTSTAGPLVGIGTGEANRVSLTFTPTAGTLTLTVSGTVTNAQLEIGAFRTSYIPTAGTPGGVTRAADVASISWYNQGEGTVFAEVTPNGPTPTSNEAFIAIESASNNSIRMLQQAGTGRALYQVQTPAGLQVNSPLGIGALAQNEQIKIGFAFKENDFCAVRTGGFEITDTLGTVPTGLTSLELGFTAIFPTTKKSFLISRLTFWPERLPNATLQTITL